MIGYGWSQRDQDDLGQAFESLRHGWRVTKRDQGGLDQGLLGRFGKRVQENLGQDVSSAELGFAPNRFGKREDPKQYFLRLIKSEMDDLEQKKYLKIAIPTYQKGGCN